MPYRITRLPPALFEMLPPIVRLPRAPRSSGKHVAFLPDPLLYLLPALIKAVVELFQSIQQPIVSMSHRAPIQMEPARAVSAAGSRHECLR